MKVLFVTRKYPPSKGGMEKISYGVISNFPELNNAKVISWGGSQKWLFFFIPWAFLKSCYFLIFKKMDVIHFWDAALSFMGFFLKKMFKVPVVVTAHGLDLTYTNRTYQWIMTKTLKDFDKVICVSKATMETAILKGVNPDRCTVINDGLNTSEWYLPKNKSVLKKELGEKLKLDLENKCLLFSVGRLVERKGIKWFIENVFPKLSKDYIFLVAGTGKEEENIKNGIIALNLTNQVFMLGRVSDDILRLLYNSSDIFIMPNIPIEGDMEGFGIVVIEAASCGLPVIASKIEGLQDAIVEGKNGFLVEPYNVKEYVRKIIQVRNIKDLNGFRKKQIEFTRKNYDLKSISLSYYNLFKGIINKKQ